MIETEVKYSVFWSEDDKEWVCHPDGEPSYAWLAPTPTEALAGFMENLLADMVTA